MEIRVKKIVMFEGGVETLAYFSKQMAGQFEKMGYAVFFYDLKDEKESAKRLRKFIKPGETVMITFNFQGLEKEAGVYGMNIRFPVIILRQIIRTIMITVCMICHPDITTSVLTENRKHIF